MSHDSEAVTANITAPNYPGANHLGVCAPLSLRHSLRRNLRRFRGRSGAPATSATLLPMEFDPYTACGIVGAGCFIFAYFATLQGWLHATGWRFPAVNLLGAALVLVSLADAWNLPSVVLESFWALISVYGLLRRIRPRR